MYIYETLIQNLDYKLIEGSCAIAVEIVNEILDCYPWKILFISIRDLG